jgi:hypothetical protein
LSNIFFAFHRPHGQQSAEHVATRDQDQRGGRKLDDPDREDDPAADAHRLGRAIEPSGVYMKNFVNAPISRIPATASQATQTAAVAIPPTRPADASTDKTLSFMVMLPSNGPAAFRIPQ